MLTIHIIKPSRNVFVFDLSTAGRLIHTVELQSEEVQPVILSLEAIDQRIDQAIGAIVSTLSAETDVAVEAGQPLRMLDNGHLALAQANTIASARMCGVGLADTAATIAATYSADGIVNLDDWSSMVGAIDLIPGSTYYLSPHEPGKLTAIAPTESGQIVAVAGIALNARTLAIEIQPLILL